MLNSRHPASAADEIDERLSSILTRLLPSVPFKKYEEKVIHDNLLESCYFTGWEIALLDTPLLQRLRGIHQLGTAALTYPSAIHNRFSHTLGVTTLAGQLYKNLRLKRYLTSKYTINYQDEEATVRLAGLLHDIGHTFFSHCSEELIKPFWLLVMKQEGLEEKPKPHEYIAYRIIRHPCFRKYWKETVRPHEYDISINLDEVANIIIGREISPDKAYLTQIINGHYDVDKLEYLHRDAKTAGLAITYDKARYFQKIDIFEKDGKATLVMGQGGIQCVEQMALGKIMLYPYVYRHHKVLTADSLVQDIVMGLLDGKQINSFAIEHPLDLLLYTDHDLLASSVCSCDASLNGMLQQLRYRNLPKRAFIIHREYLVPDSPDGELSDAKKESRIKFNNEIKAYPSRLSIRKALAKLINEATGAQLSAYDVFITQAHIFSGYASLNSAPILTRNNKCEEVGKFWLLSGWTDSHDSKTDYIYFHVPAEVKEAAFHVILTYMKEQYSLDFLTERIQEHCKFSNGN